MNNAGVIRKTERTAPVLRTAALHPVALHPAALHPAGLQGAAGHLPAGIRTAVWQAVIQAAAQPAVENVPDEKWHGFCGAARYASYLF